MPAAAIRASLAAITGEPGERVAAVPHTERRYHPLVRVVTTEDIAR